jgi:hypothetical protein
MTISLGGTVVEVETPTPPLFQVVLPNSPVVQVFPAGGPPGPPGPPGPSGNTFRYSQMTPSATWVVNHNLGKHPSVTIVLDGQGWVISDIDYLDDNNISIQFPTPVTGTADM